MLFIHLEGVQNSCNSVATLFNAIKRRSAHCGGWGALPGLCNLFQSVQKKPPQKTGKFNQFLCYRIIQKLQLNVAHHIPSSIITHSAIKLSETPPYN